MKIFLICMLVITITIFPLLTNFIVNLALPLNIKVNQESIWIGYHSSYFGAIFGGVLSGLFTYYGVLYTIKKSEKADIQRNRSYLIVREAFNVNLDLSNVSDTGSRLLRTTNYLQLTSEEILRGVGLFIIMENVSENIAINCSIVINSEVIGYHENIIINEFVPIIEGKGKVYIPIVPPHTIQDDVDIVISSIEVDYETIKNELLRIEGRVQTINETRVRIDNYQIQTRNGLYEPLFDLRGTRTQWSVIE